MGESKDFEALLKDLKKVNDTTAPKVFTRLFQRGYKLFGYSGNAAARAFDTSETTIRRWKSGDVVPPAAALVLGFLRSDVEKQLHRGGQKVRPATAKRSAPKKAPSKKPAPKKVVLGRANPNYPLTATTFWKQMEPALHAVMDAALKKTGIASATKSDYKGVTRRIYRAAIISATTFLQKKTQASKHFLEKQGQDALNKAVTKLFDGQDELDNDGNSNEYNED